MKRFLALWMICMLLVPSALAAGEDYTVAEKLLKQLWAGSGFSATLTLEAEGESFSTAKPITAALDYIYVPQTADSAEEHRVDLTMMDGENALSAAHAQLLGETLSVQADVLSPDWYTFAAEASGDAESRQSVLNATGIPSLAQTVLTVAAALQGADGLEEVLAPYTTRIDVWIEGYRQDPVMGKLADGTSTMELNYTVSPANVKSQVKQLLLDLFSDEAAMTLLRDALGKEAELYLKPALQEWYFYAVDALKLAGDMTISRTVSLRGETLALSLSMPLYDREGGRVTLTYDRATGEGDLPDSNTVRMESELRQIELTYQTYSSMTGVQVVQGSLRSEPSFTVAEDEALLERPLAVNFTLKQEKAESRDDEERDVYTYNLSLSLAPETEGAFEETEIVLSAVFASKELKSAATQIKATMVVASGKDSVSLTLDGKSRKKWEPVHVPEERVAVSSLTDTDKAALLSGAALRAAALFAPYLQQAAEAPAQTDAP